MLKPFVSVVLHEDVTEAGRTYKAGGRYTMPKDAAYRLRKERPGSLRVVLDGGDPPQRDKMLYGDGIRHG